MVEEKKSVGFLDLPEDQTIGIYEYLSGRELVQMKVVGAEAKRNQWLYVQRGIKDRVSQMPYIPDVKTVKEKENIWRIYECFQALEDNKKRSPSAEIPPLPPAPVDRYATLRHKTRIHELTTQERDLLKLDNLFPAPFQPSENSIHALIPTLPKPPLDTWASLRGKRYIRELTSSKETQHLSEMQLLSSKGLFSANIPKLPAVTVDTYASIRAKFHTGGRLTVEEIRLLQRANLLLPTIQRHEDIPLPFPELPTPPVDPWAKLRTKRTMRELTLLEIHRLFSQGLLDDYLQQLARSDCEKAALIMEGESGFLRSRLPRDELKATLLWPHKICGLLFVPIISSIIGIILCGLMLIVCAGVFTFALLFSFRPKIRRLCLWAFFKIVTLAILLIFAPICCFFTGFYFGFKYGFSNAAEYLFKSILIFLVKEEENFEDLDLNLIVTPRIQDFKDLLPPQTIADIALNADRVKKKDDIKKFNIEALALPLSRESTAVLPNASLTAVATPDDLKAPLLREPPVKHSSINLPGTNTYQPPAPPVASVELHSFAGGGHPSFNSSSIPSSSSSSEGNIPF